MAAFASRPAWWAVASIFFAVVGHLLVAPTPCSAVQECETNHLLFPNKLNGCAALGLSFVCLYEIISLISTYRGVSEAKALVPDIRSRCLPSLLLTIMFSILVAQHSTFASSPTAWYASARLGGAAPDGTNAWPLYTITYVEWMCVVPLLLTAAGHCAINRPVEELARPIVVTNFYIVLSWMAMLTANTVFRWTLVVVSFALYFFASWDMIQWVAAYWRSASPDLPSRRLRPCLSIGLVLLFAVYGVVYLLALVGSMSPWTERMSYLFLDVGSKLAMGISFVVIRANEYHRTLTSVLKRVGTSNVALVSILRGSFDFMLPCSVDERGLCVLPETAAADMLRLEHELGRPIAGKRIGDLLTEDRERENLAAYVKNTLRQADGQDDFSGVTLSMQGEWSTGHLPPVAQVLNCRMACGEGAPAKSVQCAIHLSVVPHSSFSVGPSVTHLVAAVRFEHDEVAATVPEEEVMEASFAPHESAADDQDGIVASLNDIANLGMSSILKSVRGGDSVSGDDDKSTAPSVTSLAQLAAAQKKRSSARTLSGAGSEGTVSSVAKLMVSQLEGRWRGRASESLGDYEQTFHFLEDGKHMEVCLLGRTLVGEYTVDCSQSPHCLDLQVFCDDGSMPPPIPYIFDFTKAGALRICGPDDEEMARPVAFEGAGLCVLERMVSTAESLKRSTSESTASGGETASTGGMTERLPSGRPAHRGASFERTSSPGASSMGFERSVTPGSSGCFSRQTSCNSAASELYADFGGEDMTDRPSHLDVLPMREEPSFMSAAGSPMASRAGSKNSTAGRVRSRSKSAAPRRSRKSRLLSRRSRIPPP